MHLLVTRDQSSGNRSTFYVDMKMYQDEALKEATGEAASGISLYVMPGEAGTFVLVDEAMQVYASGIPNLQMAQLFARAGQLRRQASMSVDKSSSPAVAQRLLVELLQLKGYRVERGECETRRELGGDAWWFTWAHPTGRGDVEVGETFSDEALAWLEAAKHFFEGADFPEFRD